MQQENNIFPTSIKLLIVCLRSETSKVRQIISSHTVLDWERLGEIKLLPIPDNFRCNKLTGIRHRILVRDVLREINTFAPPHLAIRVIIVGHIPGDFSNYSGVLRFFNIAPSYKIFDEILPPILKGISLDWKTKITNNLRHFNNPPQINTWLKQFEVLDKEWIGQSLLQLLDFWPDHKICEALFEADIRTDNSNGEDFLSRYDLIVYNDTSQGKSAAVISRYIKNKWGFNDKIKSLPHAIQLEPKGQRILFFEDCIMTGTECMNLFKDKNFAMLLSNHIDFKFAVGTQYGLSRFATYIKRTNLHETISIIQPRMGHIQNLTSLGIRAFKDNNLFDTNYELIDRNNHLINGIILKTDTFFNASQRARILHFCETIGEQLMMNNLQRSGYEATLAIEMASKHCFGFGNLGLLVAFAHSIPDNLIPLFRLGGKVFYRGKHVEWLPLFKQIGT
jgi:hypothetical protein